MDEGPGPMGIWCTVTVVGPYGCGVPEDGGGGAGIVK